MKENRPSPALCDIAKRILAQAAQGRERAPLDAVDTALLAYANMRSRLAKFLGPSGFDALMARSLAISAAIRPEFSGLRLDSDGTVQGLRDFAEGLAVADVLDGLEFVVSQMVYLVSTFIGEDLTERLIGDSRPVDPETYYDAISREAQ